MTTTKHRKLSTQLLAMQFAVLLLTTGIGFALAIVRFQGQLDTQFERRALGVAQTVAATDSIADLVQAGDPGGQLESIAAGIRHTTGAAYVVITNEAGIRYSHPNPLLIGRPVQDDPEPPATEPIVTGRPWTGIQVGTLGRTARGKAPILDGGRVVGEVSVGFPVSGVTDVLVAELPGFAIYMLIALGAGVVVSYLLARRLKRQTFGLELDEVSSLLQQREATLHGIREGVVGLDARGAVSLVNDEARRMLGIGADCLGHPATALGLPDRLQALFQDPTDAVGAVVLVGSRVLVASKRPVLTRGRLLGHVVTLHDRTEPEGLLRELEAVLGLTEALRAQSHDFLNRLHTMLGLVELQEYDELQDYITTLSHHHNQLMHRLATSIGDPLMVALLLAKTAVAAERGADLQVAPQTRIVGRLRESNDVITIVGNLVDNAIDASADRPDPWIRVLLRSEGTDLRIVVSDSGPGIPESLRGKVFLDGYSTKSGRAAPASAGPARSAAHCGLGLALVRQLVLRRHGRISVGGGTGVTGTDTGTGTGTGGTVTGTSGADRTVTTGAVFTVVLPRCVQAPPAAPPAPPPAGAALPEPISLPVASSPVPSRPG